MSRVRNEKVSILNGQFWIPSSCVRDADRVEGVLKHSVEGTTLELESDGLFREFALLPYKMDAWKHRVVGTVADGVFVSIAGCDHTGTTHYSMRRNPRMAFKVTGNVFLSNDERLVSPAEINANEAYVEIGGLPEWFGSPLSHPDSSVPYSTGIPLSPNTRVEAKCDDSKVEMNLDDDFKLSIQNTLYWGSDGFFDLRVRQATVARIYGAGSVGTDLLLEKVRPLADLIRFLSGKDCVLRSTYLYSMDRTLPERYGGGPIGMRLLTNKQGHQFVGWGEMLFQRKDIAGHEDRFIRNWYRLYAEKRYALRLLDSVVNQGESVEGGIVLLVGTIQALTSHGSNRKYENFLRDLGLEEWGINVKTIGEKISNLRSAPAHGRPLPTDENVASIYRFVVAAIRIYFLSKMGFSEEQLHRIATRHRGVREGLGLTQENLVADAYDEMLEPGWIIDGGVSKESHG